MSEDSQAKARWPAAVVVVLAVVGAAALLTGFGLRTNAAPPTSVAATEPTPTTVAPEPTPTSTGFDETEPTQPREPVPTTAPGDLQLPLYDTAWKLPAHGTAAEADAYFAHLAETGFVGAWISYFNHDGMEGRNVNGDVAATGGFAAPIELTDEHRLHVQGILNAAGRHDQQVGIVAIWANHYVNDGRLNADNAYAVGRQLGEAFGDHPSVSMWLAGGDNFRSREDPEIWRRLVAGLRDAGADQPVGYHTGVADPLRFADEPWLDFLAPQTGHCRGADWAGEQLTGVVEATDKPVFAAEMRYERIRPSWCETPGGVVSAEAVLADTQAALAAGVNGIVYGHNDRWQWGTNLHGGSGGGGAGALASLGSVGEQLVVAQLTTG